MLLECYTLPEAPPPALQSSLDPHEHDADMKKRPKKTPKKPLGRDRATQGRDEGDGPAIPPLPDEPPKPIRREPSIRQPQPSALSRAINDVLHFAAMLRLAHEEGRGDADLLAFWKPLRGYVAALKAAVASAGPDAALASSISRSAAGLAVAVGGSDPDVCRASFSGTDEASYIRLHGELSALKAQVDGLAVFGGDLVAPRKADAEGDLRIAMSKSSESAVEDRWEQTRWFHSRHSISPPTLNAAFRRLKNKGRILRRPCDDRGFEYNVDDVLRHFGKK